MILTALKIILYPILIGPAFAWFMVLTQPESRQKGEFVQQFYTTPMIVSVTIMVTCYALYYFLIKTGLVQRRMFIAYMRFFTGTRDMDDVRESWHSIIYLVTCAVLAIPYNKFFRWSNRPADARRVHEVMLRKISKPYLKTNYAAFWMFLDQWEKLEFKDDVELRAILDEYPGLVDDDHDFFEEINSYNLYHNLHVINNHLYSVLVLRHYFRGAIYSTFSQPEILKNAADLDVLTDLFIEKRLFSYVPFSAWWVPAAANATCSTHIPMGLGGQPRLLRREVPLSFWIPAAYMVDQPFPDFSWNPQYGRDPYTYEELYVLEDWLYSHHKLPYFIGMHSKHFMKHNWLPHTFDPTDVNLMRSRFLQLTLIKLMYKIDYAFKHRRRRAFRYMDWIYHPIGTSWADKIVLDWEWEDEVETAIEDEIRLYQPEEAISYYKTLMRSDVDDIWWWRLPKWQREWGAEGYGEHMVPVTLVNLKRRHYFFQYRKRHDWWWWENWRRFDRSRYDPTIWLARRFRFRNIYTLFFLSNAMLSMARDPTYLMLSDGMSPHNMVHRVSMLAWIRRHTLFHNYHPRIVYETWGTMTDSTYALDLMNFEELGNPTTDGGSVWAMDTYYGTAFFDYPKK